MTADDLAALARALYGGGHGSIKRLAGDLGVSYDSLRQVMSGRRAMPSGWERDIQGLIADHAERASAGPITPPPLSLRPEDDRDGPCGEALDPHLDALARRAAAAGWHPAEVAAATLGWALHAISDAAGEDAARDMLRQAGEMLTLRTGLRADEPSDI